MTKPRKTKAANTTPAKCTSANTSHAALTLSASHDIPLNRLSLAASNVRHLKTDLAITELAADIAHRGLLQGLSVRRVLDADGAETGRYEIPAGGRRFRALKHLVAQGRLAADALIPCLVREEGLAEEDSLAENVHREALHPLDQYRAFAELVAKGLGEEAIAARFFVSPTVVRQRLKLAAASPKLLDLYAGDELTLEQLMAFCVSDDHARQEQVWEALQQGYNREPYLIRRMLTEHSVRADDPRARFVGVAAYEAAGGTVLRDLFQQDGGGWLTDVALLERLVADKLEREATAIRAEGWAWVTVAPEFSYGLVGDLSRIYGEVPSLNEAEQAALDELQAQRDAAVAEHEEDEELPPEAEQRVDELDAAIAAIEERLPVFQPAELARGGAFVSLGHDGRLRVERGFVRPEDASPAADERGDASAGADPAGRARTATAASAVNGQAAEDEDGAKPLSQRLIGELTAHRTMALRDAVAQDPDTALLALLHALCLSLFQRRATPDCLEISATSASFAMQAPLLAATEPARAVEARHAAWARQLPDDPAALWTCLVVLDHDSRMALLAHCVGQTINAVQEPWGQRAAALAQADRLAGAVGLDLAASWAPTVANYLGQTSKARILEAVREARGEASVQLIDHLRKADMAREAERLLAGTGWLPELLRAPGEGAPILEHPETTAPEPLPDFLTEGMSESEPVSQAFEANARAAVAA